MPSTEQSTAEDTVDACPDCDEASIVKRSEAEPERQYPERYRCTKCNHHFDKPSSRPPSNRTQSPQVNRLLDADPDTTIRAAEDS